MAQLVLLFMVVSQVFVIVAMATEPNVKPMSSTAAAPTIRRLGKHENKHNILNFSSQPPHLSPTSLPQTKNDHAQSNKERNSSNHQDLVMAPMADIAGEKHHHHLGSFDKSMTGGGVILGGLATTFLVVIFCYIRSTRRNSLKPQPTSP